MSFQPTASKWLLESDYTNENRKLETPPGKTFDVITVEFNFDKKRLPSTSMTLKALPLGASKTFSVFIR
jgi:hypothetical protein